MLAYLITAIAGLSYESVSEKPRYVRFTERFAAETRAKADIPAIRKWIDTFDPPSPTTQPAEMRDVKLPPPEAWPECIRRLDPTSQRTRYDSTNRTIVFEGKMVFDHYGLTVAPKGARSFAGMYPGQSPRRNEFIVTLDDGVWVWYHED